MRAHEAVRAGDEHRAPVVDVAELLLEVVERFGCPEGVVRHGAYASASVSKRTGSSGFGSLRSGALTATSMLLVAGVAAVIGIVIAQEFGRTDETDGFLAAYGVFVVIGIAAQAIRLVVLPHLARARLEDRLAGELAGFALALGVFAVPLLLLTAFARDDLAELLTGGDSQLALETAADALRWVVPAAVAHLFAALAASGLAALDDYGTAAAGYALGSVAGLASDRGARRAGRYRRGRLGNGSQRLDRAGRAAGGARVSRREHPHAGSRDAAFRPAAALAPRRVRCRRGAAARAATPVRRLPPVRSAAGYGRGDQLRLRISGSGVAGHDHRGLARDRHVRSVDPPGPRCRGDGAACRGNVLAGTRGRRRRVGDVRARRWRPRRGSSRRRLRRGHRGRSRATSSSRSAPG